MLLRKAALKGKGEASEHQDNDPNSEDDDKENRAVGEDLPDLEYTGEQIMELAQENRSGDQDGFLLDRDEHIKRYVWLASWFLQGVVSADTWKEEVIGRIRYQGRRRNITQWMSSSDMAYLCVIYIHSYDKWKKEAEMRIGRSSAKLSRQEHEFLRKMGKYQPDGISSEEGRKKFLKIQAHYGFKIKEEPEAKVKFNEDFWSYYDTHLVPIVNQERGEKTTPAQEESLEFQALLEEEEKENEMVTRLAEL